MTNQTKKLKLFSKNQKSLEHFIKLITKINSKWKTNKLILSTVKKKRKRITILKSPHVNKKAQEQFQSITYSAILTYSYWYNKKSFILLKKIKNQLFPDVKIKIEQTIFVRKSKLDGKNLFLPENIYYYNKNISLNQKEKREKLTTYNMLNKKKVLLKNTIVFLKVLHRYGNFC